MHDIINDQAQEYQEAIFMLLPKLKQNRSQSERVGNLGRKELLT